MYKFLKAPQHVLARLPALATPGRFGLKLSSFWLSTSLAFSLTLVHLGSQAKNAPAPNASAAKVQKISQSTPVTKGVPASGALSSKAATQFAGIGRTATPQEVSAWDIDVRPDFKGLPKGAGSVAKGMDVWEAKCASCHGVFGEAVEVFSPIVGGTTKEDLKTGKVARLTDESFPGRTTLMKLSSLSTLWDYINRAMPWTQPKTLTTEEVYAVTAYILNLGNIIPDNFVLSDQNMAQVQALLPNRNGMTAQHALWPGKSLGSKVSKADTQNTLCMRNCGAEAQVSSTLPDFARDAHGNLAEQNRLVGAQRGADTSKPENKAARPLALTAGRGLATPSRFSRRYKHAAASSWNKQTSNPVCPAHPNQFRQSSQSNQT